MDFSNTLNKLGTMAVNKAIDFNDECEMYKDKNSELSDEALFKRYRSSTKKSEKIACMALLKDRGYGKN